LADSTRKSNCEPEDDLPVPAQQVRDGTKRRLFWSVGAQFIAIALRVVQQLVLVPVLIWGWGAELYQDWIIVFSATASLSMFDLGMQIYFNNALQIAWSRQDIRAYRRLIATGFGTYAVILSAAVLLLTGTLSVFSWSALLGTRGMSPSAVLWTAGLLATATLVLIPFCILTGVYRARGDYGLSATVSTAADVFRAFGACAVVTFGGPPIIAAWVYFGIALVAWILVVLDQRRRYGEAPLAIDLPTMQETKLAASKAALYMAPTFVTPVVANGPVILLGMLSTTPGAVVTFVVSRTFTGVIRQMVQQLCFGVGGEIGRKHALEDFAGVRRLLTGAGRLAAGTAGLLGGIGLVLAEPFIRIWTHGQVPYDPWLVNALIVTIILTAPAQAAFMIFLFTNKPAVLPLANGGYAIGTLVFCALLIGNFSALGAAIGTGLAECLSMGLLLPYVACREVSLPFLPSLRHWGAIALLGSGVSYGAAIAIARFLPVANFSSLIEFAVLWTIVIAIPAFFLVADRTLRDWILRQARSRISGLLQSVTRTKAE
jgi:O-antigen/teichoic acid export membrane protein